MKKVAVLTLAFFFSVVLAYGQASKTDKTQTKEVKKEQKTPMTPLKKLQGIEVSQVSKDNFMVDFGNIPDVEWVRSAYFDEARFTKNGKKVKAFYGFDGKLVGTSSDASFTDLPANAQREIKSMYKDYTVGNIIYFDDNETNQGDMFLYGQQFEDADNYFVEMAKGSKKIVLQVTPGGDIFFFTEIV